MTHTDKGKETEKKPEGHAKPGGKPSGPGGQKPGQGGLIGAMSLSTLES